MEEIFSTCIATPSAKITASTNRYLLDTAAMTSSFVELIGT
jgi:hypothetical protein